MAVVFVISVCICRNLSTTFQIKQDRVLVVVIAGVKKKKVWGFQKEMVGITDVQEMSLSSQDVAKSDSFTKESLVDRLVLVMIEDTLVTDACH